ncbi:hypothetical protein [Portibacter marinus]|uniref:hypothetical protein n=1 Tax=Portibacter marinus TaxID=2898660 RepID=UPI001F48FE58|nr:hypothetical protein [Portibacter marinus]
MRFAVLMVLFLSNHAMGQNDSNYIDFSAFVRLDSVTITAKKEGFSVEEFIRIIQNDNTLELSFNQLRTLNYKYHNNITFYNNNGKTKAFYESVNIQHFNGICQWMEVLTEKSSGNYDRYYTMDLYDRVFYQPTTPCSERPERSKPSRSKRILENRIDELKKLIYRPGQPASVPLIGDKTAIFSEAMIENYDFSIESKANSYVFRASIKPFYNIKHPNGSVVKFLEVEMSKESLQVLQRNYKLQYDAGIYHFDILILVDLERFGEQYLTSDIQYKGYWKVWGKPKEICTFHFKILELL